MPFKGEVVQRLVRSDSVVDTLPFDELLVELCDGPGTLVDFVELFGVSLVSPLY